jgi:hypothetical protein
LYLGKHCFFYSAIHGQPDDYFIDAILKESCMVT